MLESLEVLDPVKPYDNIDDETQENLENPINNNSMLSSVFKEENFQKMQ